MMLIRVIGLTAIFSILILLVLNGATIRAANTQPYTATKTSINVLVYDNCTEAIKHLFGIRIELVVTVYSNGYKVYVYYSELGYKHTQLQSIVHDPLEGFVAFCKGGNKVTWLEDVIKNPVNKLVDLASLYDTIKNVSNGQLYFCNGVFLVAVPRNAMGKALQLVKAFVSDIFEENITYLSIKQVTVCGLSNSPAEALSEETYEKIDALLRKLYSGLDLGLMHYECGKRRGIWSWKDLLTGLPVLPITTKYYEEVVRGNKSIARAIGLAVADVLHRIGYPLKTVEVRLRPPGILVCRFSPEPVKGNLTATLAKLAQSTTREGTNAESVKRSLITTTGTTKLVMQHSPTFTSAAESEEGKNYTIRTKMVEKIEKNNTTTTNRQIVAAVRNPSSKTSVTRNDAAIPVAIVVASSILLFVAIVLARRR